MIIEVTYGGEGGTSGTFTLNISRNLGERATETPTDGENKEEITVYARVD